MGKKKRDGYRPGQYFELLVKDIESALADRSAVSIESPAHLRDHQTGGLREFDVLITADHPLRAVITAIECKDQKARVDVAIVEAFNTKCGATGVNLPVIASRSGFTKGALLKAKALGIRTVTALDSAKEMWELEFIGHRIVTEVFKKPSVQANHYAKVPEPLELWQIGETGEELNVTESIYELGRFLFRNAHDEGLLDLSDDQYRGEIRTTEISVGEPFGFYIRGSNGETSEVANLVFTFDYRRTAHPLETEDIHYRDEQSGKAVPYARFKDTGGDIPKVSYVETKDGTFEVHQDGNVPQKFHFDGTPVTTP